jgi:hypothetical protein
MAWPVRQGDAKSTTTTAMRSFYDPERAATELCEYREKGPIPSTRAQIEALKAEGVAGATLLDIGGGIGAIQHEPPRRRGHDGRVTFMRGDLVDLADSIAPAEVRTLRSSDRAPPSPVEK